MVDYSQNYYDQWSTNNNSIKTYLVGTKTEPFFSICGINGFWRKRITAGQKPDLSQPVGIEDIGISDSVGSLSTRGGRRGGGLGGSISPLKIIRSVCLNVHRTRLYKILLVISSPAPGCFTASATVFDTRAHGPTTGTRGTTEVVKPFFSLNSFQ